MWTFRAVPRLLMSVNIHVNLFYWGGDKSLALPTSRCILFDGENVSFDASFLIYRMSQEECARLQEGVPYVKYTDITQNTYVQS
jgi:hypothetical protein